MATSSFSLKEAFGKIYIGENLNSLDQSGIGVYMNSLDQSGIGVCIWIV